MASESDRPQRFFRALLRALPFDFRADYGRDMEQVFRAQHRDARKEGSVVATVRLWAETVRDVISTAPREHLSILRQDVVYALRTLRRAPVFTVATIITFACGIAAASGVFIILNAFLFRPLPVHDPDALVTVSNLDQHVNLPHGLSFADLQDYRNESEVFVDLLAYSVLPAALNAGGGAERITIDTVSDNYFSLLGVIPAAGRVIRPDEGRGTGDAAVLVLTYEYWQARFGSDPSIVGRAVRLNGKTLTVIGVAQRGFAGVDAFIRVAGFASLWMRDGFTGVESILENRDRHALNVLGRLRPGVTAQRAQAALDARAATLAREYPETNRNVSLQVVPEVYARPNPSISRYFHVVATAIAALAALLLLVTSANVANLLIARAATRGREVGLRSALGARRGRLVRQFLTESIVLSLLGSLAAFPLALLVMRAFARVLGSVTAEVAIGPNLTADWRVIGATFLLAVGAGIVSGFAPIAYTLRGDLSALLQSGPRQTSSAAGGRFRRLLVVGQVAISLTLLVSGALFLRSLGRVRGIDLGFDPKGVLLAATSPNMQGYNSAQLLTFYQEAARRVTGLAGVEHAAWISAPPLAIVTNSASVSPEGQPVRPDSPTTMAVAARVDADYFATARVPFTEGRGFSANDDQQSRPVAIINQTLAQQFWPGQSPIGRRVVLKDVTVEVVGVVRNGRYQFVWESPRGMLFRPLLQDVPRFATLVVRTPRSPADIATSVRRAIRAADPEVPIYDVRPMVDYLDDGQSFLFFRIGALVTGVFGAMGVLLASVGLYGMVAYHVTQRTKEIGLRMALGARAAEIVRHLVGRSARLAAAGIVIGTALAIAVARLLGALLLDVSPYDPLTYAAVGGLLLTICLVASFIPARRATTVEPLEALRAD